MRSSGGCVNAKHDCSSSRRRRVTDYAARDTSTRRAATVTPRRVTDFYAPGDDRVIYTKRFAEVRDSLLHTRQNAESSRNE